MILQPDALIAHLREQEETDLATLAVIILMRDSTSDSRQRLLTIASNMRTMLEQHSRNTKKDKQEAERIRRIIEIAQGAADSLSTVVKLENERLTTKPNETRTT